MKFATKAIHAGLQPDPATGALMTPVYFSSTFAQNMPNDEQSYHYGRTHNPTRTALQNNLAALENATHALCFASGMAAADAILRLLRPGDEVLVSRNLYGGTRRLFTTQLAHFGIRFSFVNMRQANQIGAYIKPQTRLIWLESPGNPNLAVVDIAGIAKVAKSRNVLLCVDNTFATPFLQNPMDLGADLTLHSATKYLGGHSDVIMGAVMCNDADMHEKLAAIQNSVGAIPGPMDCFLTLRGIKTLHLRMKSHCENATAVAQFLRSHPDVAKVYWPGFNDFPNHAIAKRQMRGFGGMVSFSLKNDKTETAIKVLQKLKIFTLAESLGGVESLAGHPLSMTHGSVPPAERLKAGITDSLIRLSVGIEDKHDLIADLQQALA